MHNDTFRIVRLRHLICFMKYQPSDNISLSIFDTIESRRLAREINKFLQFTILSACWWKISAVEKCEGQISTKKTLKFSAKPKSTENQTKPNSLCVSALAVDTVLQIENSGWNFPDFTDYNLANILPHKRVPTHQ